MSVSSAPSEPVYRLMYMSTAVRDMRDAELEEILKAARDFNQTQDISGMLLYSERQFVQYLEGTEFAVESLYKKIARDPRHTGVIRLFSGPYPRRIFPDWCMGFQHYDKAGEIPIKGAIDLCLTSVREAIPPDAPEEIIVFMENFYLNSKRLREHG